MTFDIFAHTLRPDSDLFYTRDDPNDPRLGDVVRADPADYEQATVVLLGCPQDEGVRRNNGRTGAREAPDAIRRAFYRLAVFEADDFTLFDLGNTVIQPDLEATHDVHRQIVQRILRDGKVPIVLGGGDDTSYPDCVALASVSDDPLTFNIDAHLDVRADPVRNSGTPYRQLLEEGHIQPGKFYEIGTQPFANAPDYMAYLQEQGATFHTVHDLRAAGGVKMVVTEILARVPADAIFWGFDMDAVRAADAPGVSAPNPTGLTGDEFCAIAALAGADPRSRLLDLTEVNPAYDVDGRTSRLAAVALYHFLAARFEK